MILLKKVPRSPWHEDMAELAKTSRAKIVVRREVPGGGWHHVIRDGKPIVIAYCPLCGKDGDLGDHQIDAEGNVSPIVVCPHTPCTFHDMVKLDTYEP